VAAELARKSTVLFLKEWQENGHIHENYNTVLGIGDDVVGSSVRYYAWGGLLPLTMVEELIAVEAWSSGFRVGSLSDQNASLSNFWIGKDRYDVSIGPGLRVMRNGEKLLESDHPVVLRNVAWTKDKVRFDVTTKSSGQLVLYGFRNNENLQCPSCAEKQLVAREGKVALALAPEVKTLELSAIP
jgi:hypothetical protein